MEKILVYVGAHKGDTLYKLRKRYSKCYVFEPDPELFEGLKQRFKKFDNVKLFNLAVGEKDGEADFYIYDFNGANSLGKISEDLEHPSGLTFKIQKKIKIGVVNLNTFLKEIGIEEIDYYLSDIQGMDLAFLRTLKPLLDKRSIKKITCEVEKDEKPVLYAGFNNKLSEFQELLKENYSLVSNETEPSWITTDVTWVSKSYKAKLTIPFFSKLKNSR